MRFVCFVCVCAEGRLCRFLQLVEAGQACSHLRGWCPSALEPSAATSELVRVLKSLLLEGSASPGGAAPGTAHPWWDCLGSKRHKSLSGISCEPRQVVFGFRVGIDGFAHGSCVRAATITVAGACRHVVALASSLHPSAYSRHAKRPERF